MAVGLFDRQDDGPSTSRIASFKMPFEHLLRVVHGRKQTGRGRGGGTSTHAVDAPDIEVM